MSGWRRMVPVDEHGASSRIASKRSSGDQVVASAATVVAARPRRARFAESVLSRVLEMSTATTEAPASASCAVLPPGAAQRSNTRLPVDVPHEMRRQRGRDVLHPPRALVKARQRLDAALGQEAHAAIGKHAARHLLGPVFRIALHREVERRLDQIGGGDQMRPLLAVARDPALPQPVWRIDARRIEAQPRWRRPPWRRAAARR